MGTVPIAISVETSRTRLFSGTKLDVPRLAAPRGPARGRARANLRGLIYRMSVYHSCLHPRACPGPGTLNDWNEMDDPAAAYKFDLQGFIRLKGYGGFHWIIHKHFTTRWWSPPAVIFMPCSRLTTSPRLSAGLGKDHTHCLGS